MSHAEREVLACALLGVFAFGYIVCILREHGEKLDAVMAQLLDLNEIQDDTAILKAVSAARPDIFGMSERHSVKVPQLHPVELKPGAGDTWPSAERKIVPSSEDLTREQLIDEAEREQWVQTQKLWLVHSDQAIQLTE